MTGNPGTVKDVNEVVVIKPSVIFQLLPVKPFGFNNKMIPVKLTGCPVSSSKMLMTRNKSSRLEVSGKIVGYAYMFYDQLNPLQFLEPCSQFKRIHQGEGRITAAGCRR